MNENLRKLVERRRAKETLPEPLLQKLAQKDAELARALESFADFYDRQQFNHEGSFSQSEKLHLVREFLDRHRLGLLDSVYDGRN